jgi:acetoin utilization protein AcuC
VKGPEGETIAATTPARSLARVGPVVVFGAWSTRYDFGPLHPLTPRRFGPAIDLLRAIGAEEFIEPRVAGDAELERIHDPAYLEIVRSFSEDPAGPPRAGIGPGDCPAFPGMHEASAAVAGGSLDAVASILDGGAEHAFHPGGGLHHAMPGRASGFCIYNDVALGVARARDASHRILYVDLDVHHGDGTEACFYNDPQVLTVSIHETGLALFPGTGFVEESGGPDAEGTAVNVPLLPGSGDASWCSAVETVVPALADAWRPTFLVTQHGCDSHALDPLAHQRVTTAAYWRADRLMDELAHHYCEGRWLATGGGGYDVYRVIPRAWSLVWLAQAHREPPRSIPTDWRERWSEEADRRHQAPPPDHFLDPPDLVTPDPEEIVSENRRTVELALSRFRRLSRRAE